MLHSNKSVKRDAFTNTRGECATLLNWTLSVARWTLGVEAFVGGTAVKNSCYGPNSTGDALSILCVEMS